jgi:hypothetical protein
MTMNIFAVALTINVHLHEGKKRLETFPRMLTLDGGGGEKYEVVGMDN